MKLTVLAAAAAISAAALAPAALAQGGPPQGPSEIAIDAIGAGEEIEVTLPDILGDNGEVKLEYTSYGDSVSPEISWSAVDGAESYAVILQDPVDMGGGVFIVLHWAAYNIPADVTMLPKGVPAGVDIEGIPGAKQANNISGAPAYAGPRPPGERPPHQYTFQVFALDTTLDVPADVAYADLIAAMDGHVIGAGSKITPYTAPEGTPPMGGGGGGGGGQPPAN